MAAAANATSSTSSQQHTNVIQKRVQRQPLLLFAFVFAGVAVLHRHKGRRRAPCVLSCRQSQWRALGRSCFWQNRQAYPRNWRSPAHVQRRRCTRAQHLQRSFAARPVRREGVSRIDCASHACDQCAVRTSTRLAKLSYLAA